MFTGIIQQLGTIENIVENNGVVTLTITASTLASSQKKGQSVAVDGVCLTVTEISDKNITFEVIPETIQRSIIKNYKVGTPVNLEESLRIGDRLDGHMVLGHVDFVATVKHIRMVGDSKIVAIQFPLSFAKHFALKGSVTLNGISLTISHLEENFFEVSLIPETIKTTNFVTLAENDSVNVEIDTISRYLDRLLQDRAQQTTYQFLEERGFI